MKNFPLVYIIILNWNGWQDTIECLESLKKQTYRNFRIVVVDNGSSGPDVDILGERYGDFITIIENKKNYGFAGGNNVGIKYALKQGADYILLLNNDTILDPYFLEEVLKVAEQDPKVGIVGGKVYYYHYPNILQSVGGKVNWWIGKIYHYGDCLDRGQFDEVAERDFVYATAMLVKREVFEKIGLLDPTLFFGIEEYDFCTRAKKAGYRVMYTYKAKIWHKGGASRKKLPKYEREAEKIFKMSGIFQYKYYLRIYQKFCKLGILPLFYHITISFLKAPIKLLLSFVRKDPRPLKFRIKAILYGHDGIDILGRKFKY